MFSKFYTLNLSHKELKADQLKEKKASIKASKKKKNTNIHILIRTPQTQPDNKKDVMTQMGQLLVSCSFVCWC